MKKYTFLFAFFILAFNARSQSIYFLGGATQTQMNWERYLGPSAASAGFLPESIRLYETPGYGFSFFGGKEYLNRGKFSLTSEIGMTHHEAHGSGSPRTLKMNLIGGNTMINFSFFRKVKLILQAGPRLDYMYNYEGLIYTLSSRGRPVELDISKWNYGLLTGVGAKVKLSYALYMGLNVRYSFLNNYLVNENGDKSRPEHLFANLMVGVELE